MPEPCSWTAAYERALTETDATRLHARVIDAEDAILTRSLELSSQDGSVNSETELWALSQAMDGLLNIKTEKLGWRLT